MRLGTPSPELIAERRAAGWTDTEIMVGHRRGELTREKVELAEAVWNYLGIRTADEFTTWYHALRETLGSKILDSAASVEGPIL